MGTHGCCVWALNMAAHALAQWKGDIPWSQSTTSRNSSISAVSSPGSGVCFLGEFCGVSIDVLHASSPPVRLQGCFGLSAFHCVQNGLRNTGVLPKMPAFQPVFHLPMPGILSIRRPWLQGEEDLVRQRRNSTFAAGSDDDEARDDATCSACADGQHTISNTACGARRTTCGGGQVSKSGSDDEKARDDTPCATCSDGQHESSTSPAMRPARRRGRRAAAARGQCRGLTARRRETTPSGSVATTTTTAERRPRPPSPAPSQPPRPRRRRPPLPRPRLRPRPRPQQRRHPNQDLGRRHFRRLSRSTDRSLTAPTRTKSPATPADSGSTPNSSVMAASATAPTDRMNQTRHAAAQTTARRAAAPATTRAC